jgi:hypothetical protein
MAGGKDFHKLYGHGKDISRELQPHEYSLSDVYRSMKPFSATQLHHKFRGAYIDLNWKDLPAAKCWVRKLIVGPVSKQQIHCELNKCNLQYRIWDQNEEYWVPGDEFENVAVLKSFLLHVMQGVSGNSTVGMAVSILCGNNVQYTNNIELVRKDNGIEEFELHYATLSAGNTKEKKKGDAKLMGKAEEYHSPIRIFISGSSPLRSKFDGQEKQSTIYLANSFIEKSYWNDSCWMFVLKGKTPKHLSMK